jgi:protein O-GlcNAc transferase
MSDAISPLIFVWLEDSPEQQFLRATRYAAEKFPSMSASPPKASVRPSKIRLGYFSAEFHDHAVMFQLARLFELHDRDRFSIHAFSFGPTRISPMRSRLTDAFDDFHEVAAMDSRAIADLARTEAIDIAIDLMGYTGRARTEIFAFRAAPVQMLYMGYPGTMGAPFFDYLVADPIVIPEEQRRYFAEKIICLPDSYQANDDQRRIAGTIPSRTDLGLPEQGFVFCCFNNPYKITPEEFDVWMRLLARVEESVLWLFQANASVEDNLRRSATARGVDPARLVFAERMPHTEHLARLSRADLFLDCFGCNAHATASDALWAGVPVLTVPGRGFAARVGASVTNSVGLHDMVVATREDYERLALELARNPARLADVKSRLAHNRTIMPLFDSERFTRHIESGFTLAFDRYRAGLEPDHIEVPRLPERIS